ncbi:MAG: dTDP-4-dehydrorhamnose 3,5-epimerase [Deltaproteobacteria bacterium]|nr:dTDP-4-dehydrorhamnose 3,5-epimerase [Deltaproteobacteria bacterium]
MLFEPTDIAGAFVLVPQRHEDDRGYFARTFCTDELAERGLVTRVAQCSVSWNRRAGTLRGMHYQAAPHEETKVVRCTAGAVYDVMIDLRPDSPSYRRWQAFELTAVNGRALYIPAGVAHGFQTLVDASELLYMISTPYEPTAARGVRWDDPAFAIAWPACADRTMSERDRAFPPWRS